MNPLLLLFPTIILLLGFLFARMPHLTRPDIFFSVTVDPAFRTTTEGLRILHQYQRWVWVHTAIAFVMAVTLTATHRNGLFFIPFFWQLINATVAIQIANKRTRPHAATPSRTFEVDLSPRDESLPGGIAGFTMPFVILSVSAVILQQNWDRIPQRFPVHWGLDGTPNRWVERTPEGVYGMLAFGALMCLAMAILIILISRSRRIAVRGESGRNEIRFRLLMLWTLLGSEYLLACTFGGLPILTALKGTSAGPIYVVLTAAFSIVVLTLSFRMGQGGTRLSPAGPSPHPTGDRTPDNCWKWGLFYINSDDPSLFVEKRFGIGYTVNFGNRWSWVLLLVFLVTPLGMTLLRR